jgi:AcrR family transcriptional regulator
MNAVDPTPGGWARRRERVALYIERKALELFAERGVDEVTVEDIAAAAGISVRTFFRYFPTRDDVLAALPRRENEEMSRRVAARPATESVLEAFIAAVHEPMDAGEQELVLLWGRAILNGAPRSPEGLGPDGGMVAVYSSVIADRLGVEPSDLRVQVVATAIASVTWFAFLQWVSSDGAEPLAVLAEECYDMLADLNRRTGKRQRPARRRG